MNIFLGHPLAEPSYVTSDFLKSTEQCGALRNEIQDSEKLVRIQRHKVS